MTTILIILVVLFLAYSNGANDNFKGVATLYGSNTASYRLSLQWTSIFTFLGAMLSVILATTLIKKFSGKGLVAEDVISTYRFVIAVGLGAAATVSLASRFGMPVSTTHALIGSLVGAGFIAVGTHLQVQQVGKAFLLPLLLSPLAAAFCSYLLYSLFHNVRVQTGIKKEICFCKPVLVPQPIGSGMKVLASGPLIVADNGKCEEIYAGKIFGIRLQPSVKAAHFFSAAVVCFARGLNDAPKIAGLLLLLHLGDMRLSLLGIAVAMVIGGWLHSRKIAETMSKNITPLNQGQAFSANVITGGMVVAASVFGLPVSTTHVSVGSIFGIGMQTGVRNNKVIVQILLSWLLTLPVAVIFSGCFIG